MPSDDPFHRVRRDFEALQIDEQAQFLIRASASTLARGIEQAGKALAAGLGETMHQACSPTPPHKDTPGAEEPGPAEPETAQRQVPPARPDASDA